MGKGKGLVFSDGWVCRIRAGKNLLEISNISKVFALKALNSIAHLVAAPCIIEEKN